MEATVHLQGIGRQQAKPARDFTIGELTVWNYGYRYKVASIAPSASGKTITWALTHEGKEYTRKVKADRLIGFSTWGGTVGTRTQDQLLAEIRAHFEAKPAAAYFVVKPADKRLSDALFDAGLITFVDAFDRVALAAGSCASCGEAMPADMVDSVGSKETAQSLRVEIGDEVCRQCLAKA